jgi:hypothetical protein
MSLLRPPRDSYGLLEFAALSAVGRMPFTQRHDAPAGRPVMPCNAFVQRGGRSIDDCRLVRAQLRLV